MAWVALDRAAHGIEDFGLPVPGLNRHQEHDFDGVAMAARSMAWMTRLRANAAIWGGISSPVATG
jgi:hypothetical protein